MAVLCFVNVTFRIYSIVRYNESTSSFDPCLLPLFSLALNEGNFDFVQFSCHNQPLSSLRFCEAKPQPHDNCVVCFSLMLIGMLTWIIHMYSQIRWSLGFLRKPSLPRKACLQGSPPSLGLQRPPPPLGLQGYPPSLRHSPQHIPLVSHLKSFYFLSGSYNPASIIKTTHTYN